MTTWSVGDIISVLEINQYFQIGDGVGELEDSYFTYNNFSKKPDLYIFEYVGC